MQQLLSMLLMVGTLPALAADPAIPIGTQRELFVDNHVIAELKGSATRRLQRPQPAEVVLVTDQPWEGNTCAYYTIFQDGELYRMYYRGSHFDESTGQAAHREVTCYAESKDGLNWTKPNLNLFEFNDSKENNIVWDGVGTHNFTPFLDTNPDCPPEARYKALGRGSQGYPHGLYAFHSADGIHWKLTSEKAVITNGAFDSQNLAFWDPVRQLYVDYHRKGRDGVRDIMTATSSDFQHWSEPQFLSYADDAKQHLYTNAIQRYPRAPQLLIGFPSRFVPAQSQVEPILMSSRDGVHFQRWAEPVIPTSFPEDRSGNRSNYMTWGLVQLPGQTDEYTVYATEAYYVGPSSRLRRFTFRVDGFVAVQADPKGGELITRPLVFDGSQLRLNLRTGKQGRVAVELLDENSEPLPGFNLSDCHPLNGDQVDALVTWQESPPLAQLAGKTVRLRIVLSDADLFSFQFRSDVD